MKVNIKLSDTDIKKLLKQVVILIDTREQENQHIINFFEKKKIAYKIKKLDFGDYSAELKANNEIGLPFDVTLENVVAIERKGASGFGLNEISNNFTDGRTAFENEFIRANQFCENFYLVIENGSWQDIKNHKYRSQLNENAFYNSLLSWRDKYKFNIDFVNTENVGEHIYKIICVVLKHKLEN